MSKKTSNSTSEVLETLWKEGLFKSPHSFNQIISVLADRGSNFPKLELGLTLSKTKFLIRNGKRGKFTYVQRTPADNITLKHIKNDLFSKKLIKKMGNNFSTELSDIELNFGESGTCTAFLLRKILEKLIFLTFSKNGLGDKLKNSQGKFIGLEAMINLTCSEKISGIPFLMPQTANKIKAIKFLGDISAHNPLTNVDMKTVIPQMPFIITAYEELSEKL